MRKLFGIVLIFIQILRLALQSVSKTAVPSVVVRMGNIGLIRALLAGYGLNETICFYVLSNLSTLRVIVWYIIKSLIHNTITFFI